MLAQGNALGVRKSAKARASKGGTSANLRLPESVGARETNENEARLARRATPPGSLSFPSQARQPQARYSRSLTMPGWGMG